MMDLNSPYFDRIRVRAGSTEERPEGPACDHPACSGRGLYRAPKGREREGEYWRFCLEHVRAYNHSYNYFAGLSDDAVMHHQKLDNIGHRPTWTMGVNGSARRENGGLGDASDPFELFRHRARSRAQTEPQKPRVGVAALKALEVLGLEEGVDAVAVKARYKLLVKRFHPDANGGDRSHEGRLQEIIRAYGVLRSLGHA